MNQLNCASAPIIAVFETAQSIRIIMIDDEPWFAAADVCEILGYANGRDALAKHCLEKGVAKRYTLTNRGKQALAYINEGNLYRLVIKSRMPAAEKFETWVCDEVLPLIRKTGSYSLPAAADDFSTDDGRTLTEREIADLRRRVSHIIRLFPALAPQEVSRAIYGHMKTPLRIGSINDLPASSLPSIDRMLERLVVIGRDHYAKVEQAERNLLLNNPLRVGVQS